MKVLDLTVPTEQTPDGAKWRFYPIGDPHVDMKVTNARRLKRLVKTIAADPHSLALCVGDIFNGSLPGHKYFSSKALKGEVAQHTDDYVNFLLPVVTELFGPLLEAGVQTVFVRGNHDRWVQGVDVVRLVVDLLNLKAGKTIAHYAGDEALLRVRAGHTSWFIHAQHGSGGGYTESGKIARFMNTAPKIADADIFVRGHVHDQYNRVVSKYYVSAEGKARLRRRRIAFLTAAAFNTDRVQEVSDYAGQQGLPPVDDGLVYAICVNPLTKGKADPRNHDKLIFRGEHEF
jgi:UDP-2,3-diacylglucosamine pyrophosphatase LpxH